MKRNKNVFRDAYRPLVLPYPTVSDGGGVCPPPGCRPPLEADPLDADLPVGRLPPCEQMTQGCKSITLPQTSFVAGNNVSLFTFKCCEIFASP